MKLKVFIVVVVLAIVGLFAAGVAKYEQQQKQINQERVNALHRQEIIQSVDARNIQDQNKQILDLTAQKTQLCVYIRALPQFAKSTAALPDPCK